MEHVKKNKDSLHPGSKKKSGALKSVHPRVPLPAALRTIRFLANCWQKALQRRIQVCQVLVQHVVAARDWLWKGWQ